MKIASHAQSSGLPALTAAFLVLSTHSMPAPAQEAGSTARYRARFDASWSVATHPFEFPSDAHFSGLVGGAHGVSASFWLPGELASPGIEAMAERGQKTPLDKEVEAAIAVGSALEVISGPGISRSPGSAEATFTVTSRHPLVTLVSMIAPSPDWFVGVHDLDLRASGGWAEEVVVELHAYDAGTDDGIIYASPDAEAEPHQPISRLLTLPFAGEAPLGTFTFTLLESSEPPLFRRGDANADGNADISDAVLTLIALFAGGGPLPCADAADSNDDGRLDLTDAVHLLAFLFQGGEPPPAPGEVCGLDDTPDALGCGDTATCAGAS